MDKKYLQEDDLRIGMRCSPEQLRHIYDKYMFILYDNKDDEQGILVFYGDEPTAESDKLFMAEGKAITPVFHSSMELDEDIVFDEELLCN